jgi:thiol:disulfide interchange protein
MMKYILAFLLFISSPAFAQLSLNDPNEPPKVSAKLIAENDGIAPGQTIWVALRQEITPGWHTYWRNPGDTGLATSLIWTLPAGFTASELKFPTPHRQRIGDLVNFGYEDSVMLLAQITAPVDLAIGSDTELKAKANWLVCQDTCIPESAELTLELPAKETPTPGPWASAFISAKAKLPQAHTANQTAKANKDTVEITLAPLPLSSDELPEEVYFFPHDELLIQHNADQKLLLDGRSLHLTIPRNNTRTTPIETIDGDVWLRTVTGEKSFTFTAKVEQPKPVAVTPPPAAAQPTAPPKAPTEPTSDIGFFAAIFSAFIGGLILNLMPCVFPVLSLKALGLVQKSHESTHRAMIMGGIAYGAGVLTTFTLLGVILITLKNAGAHIGWGVQLQSPIFVAALALLLFFIGYALTGAVNIGTRLMGFGNSLTQKSGLASSFFTGALAVIVATPCTAPFMGGAVFYALTQNAAVTLIVLWMLGLGLALPYLLLTIFPDTLLKHLPKPGAWMEHFKQFLAFPMLAASIWLVWVLGQQTGMTGVLYALFSMLFLSFGFWLWSTTHNRPVSVWQYVKIILALVAIVLSITLIFAQPAPEAKTNTPTATDNFQAFTPEKLAEYRTAGKPVFVNMTAAWCITCLANDKAALSSPVIKQFFADNDIQYLKGDWTNYDDAITSYLKEFGRSGVPIYVFYPADQSKEPVVLPQILSPKVILGTINPLLSPAQ